MAIIKILKSSKNFEAVLYNDKRVKSGEAKLLLAENFLCLGNSASDFQKYLKDWSAVNSRIKNSQFHVTISLKGKTNDHSHLVTLAQSWLEKMGYINNPYLIYLHDNTSNTHIHIVTTRIDSNGRKIDHSFEKQRSLKILRGLEGVNIISETRNYISGLLRYSFSTKNQFFELCRESGFTISVNPDSVTLKKGGVVVNLSNELIDFCSARYFQSIPEQRKKKIQSLIYKYAKLLDKPNFIDLMRKKFGLSFLFYGKEDSMYGFTVIDYNNRCIYKGSEVFSVKTLNNLFKEDKSLDSVYETLVLDYLVSNPLAGVGELNDYLSQRGLYVNHNQVLSLNDNSLVATLSQDVLRRLDYNKRVSEVCNHFRPQNLTEMRYLARLFDIKVRDLSKLPVNVPDNITFYNDLLNDCINQGTDIRNVLNSYGIDLKINREHYLLVDLNNDNVISDERLDLSHEELNQYLSLSNNDYSFGYYYDDDMQDESYDYLDDSIFDAFSSLFDMPVGGVSSYKHGRKNKK